MSIIIYRAARNSSESCLWSAIPLTHSHVPHLTSLLVKLGLLSIPPYSFLRITRRPSSSLKAPPKPDLKMRTNVLLILMMASAGELLDSFKRMELY